MKISNDLIIGIGVGLLVAQALKQQGQGIGTACSCQPAPRYFAPSHQGTRPWLPFENRAFKDYIPRITYNDTDKMIRGAI